MEHYDDKVFNLSDSSHVWYVNGRVTAPEDVPKDALILTSCGCHNGSGVSWFKNGSVKTSTVRERCAKHAREGHPWLDSF